MIVQDATFANAHAALQKAVVDAAVARVRVGALEFHNPFACYDEVAVIRTRKRIDDAIDRAGKAIELLDTLCMLLAIADLVAVAGIKGEVAL